MTSAKKLSSEIPRCFKISWLQKVEVYKTQARFYVIGSNTAETKFRILKIDRTEPLELCVVDDCIDYTVGQVSSILQSLYSVPGGSILSKPVRKIIPSYVGFGLLGFVRFMEGFYIILITKRSKVAEIGGNMIYKIEDTTMIYIPNSNVKIAHNDEWRYLKAFQTVDLSSNFYYSYSYDLTNTLQHNMLLLKDMKDEDRFESLSEDLLDSDDSTGESWVHVTENELTSMKIQDEKIQKDGDFYSAPRIAVEAMPCQRYLWNKYLLEPLRAARISTLWAVNIIHGHLEQACVNVYGKLIYITLIARRSSKFAGTRFMKRGCNINGDVANEVETEQIVHCASTSSLRHTPMTSYVQHRGSVPVHWVQDITASVVPAKPPITMSLHNPFCQTTGRHFESMMRRYGSPIIILNLVRKGEKRHREAVLGKEFKLAIDYLNQFLATKHQIKYFALDMAHLSRHPNSNVLVRLADIADRSLNLTGIFQSQPLLYKKTLDTDSRWLSLGGEFLDGFRVQTGVLRTNCVDCLDRTNSAQFVAGKSALAYQLFSLGVLTEPTINFDTDVARLYEEMMDQHGDIVALQYGGSQLVHTIQTYRRTVAPWTSHSRDIMTTLSRYYSNTFSDADKQSAINLFLGYYRPRADAEPLWDMVTDYYLHNDDLHVLRSFSVHDYVRWCYPDVISNLPLPLDTVLKIKEKRERSDELRPCHVTNAACDVGHCSDCSDWFDDFYQTSQLTVFEDCLALQLPNTIHRGLAYGYSDISPFAQRNENWQSWKQERLQSDSTTSQNSLDASSNESSESDENPAEAKRASWENDVTLENLATPSWFKTPTLEDFSPQKVYGIDLEHATSAQDRKIFEKYVNFQPCHDDASEVASDGIEPPTVDSQSIAIYFDSVNHNYMDHSEFYSEYLRQFSA